MKNLDYTAARKNRQPRTPSAAPYISAIVKAPPGMPDARGWNLKPATNKNRPLITHFADAFIAGKWQRRSFRGEAAARAFADAENARNPAFQAADSAAQAVPSPTLEKLLTSPECAKRLRLTLDGLDNARNRQGLPFLRIGRRELRYRWSEVTAWLESDREALQLPAAHWRVEPYKHATLKFAARREEPRERKYFPTEDLANDFARQANSALGRKPIGPVPEIVRGQTSGGAFWRVFPCADAFAVRAKVEGKWQACSRPTQREAFQLANELNFAALRQTLASAPVPPAAPPVKKPEPLPLPTVLTLPDPQTASFRMATRAPFNVHPIRRGTYRGPYTFYVSGKIAGKLTKRFFQSEKEANTFAHMRNTEVRQQGTDVLDYPAWLHVMAMRCQHLLEKRRRLWRTPRAISSSTSTAGKNRAPCAS